MFKTLFSKEAIEFSDLCETKSTTTALYLDMNEKNEENHDYRFVGKVGSFCPIKPGCGGGLLYRQKSDDQYNNQLDSWRKAIEAGKKKEEPSKFAFVGGAKDYRWLEAEVVEQNKKFDDIDKSYYNRLVDEAIDTIAKYGDVHAFINS